jgi:hypothetical protein
LLVLVVSLAACKNDRISGTVQTACANHIFLLTPSNPVGVYSIVLANGFGAIVEVPDPDHTGDINKLIHSGQRWSTSAGDKIYMYHCDSSTPRVCKDLKGTATIDSYSDGLFYGSIIVLGDRAYDFAATINNTPVTQCL